MNSPIVSACIITFQHEKFLRPCIESALMQNFNGSYEIVIGEDCSTDNTRNICIEYSKKYPDKIRLISNNTNLGMIGNWINTLNACSGKYIALCEGDDYWTDPLKLQKQVDYLETHPECSMVFHDTLVLFQDKSRQPFLASPLTLTNYDNFDTEDLIRNLFNISTCSMVFRASAISTLPDWFKSTRTGEKAIQLLISLHGSVTYLDELMSVYRSHQGGISFGKSEEYAFNVMSETLNNFNISTNRIYHNVITRQISKMEYNYKNFKLRSKYRILFFFLRPGITFRKVKMKIFKSL
jgi:glycosyltransferase involved in cell wall biosynthesis